ncbi:hydroxyacylglutathione hydrolase [Thalassotalea maritima]|uniref:hydroxyacylglutathione hydrolase n=1 Tax=Thalassotalea maritima TaxID=3242416 RepID=UPI003527B81C
MFQVQAIDAFNDNYIWCITSSASKHCVLVDPGDANVCIEYIEKNHLTLVSILLTHHHNDHVGGVGELRDFTNQQQHSLRVYGPSLEATQHSDVQVREGDTVELFDNQLTLNVIDLPGHTLGHIGFYNQDWLFCGDTLFSGGCGRLFEGSAEQLYTSLNKLTQLPESTHVYCAHEYTLANLRFAETLEPDNQQLADYITIVEKKRAQNERTIPSNIGLEKQINPFLRTHLHPVEQAVLKAKRELDEQKTYKHWEVFAMMRALKDSF